MEALISSLPYWLCTVLLILGFVFLIKGADFFVDGSSAVARRFRVPPVVIGLTIVAMGTSLPETAVSVSAALVNNNELAVSNAVGSNIFNLMVVIGCCAVLSKVPVSKNVLKSDIPFSAICAVLVMALGYFAFLSSGMGLERLDGIILLLVFIAYILILVRRTLRARQSGEEQDEFAGETRGMTLPKSIILILIGGELTVQTAQKIALGLGMSQTLVGLTIVSIGTSLPELVTSIVAARKHEIELALGNAIGSNIFNFLMVLGIAAAISPVSFIAENLIDIVVLLIFTGLVWVMAYSKRSLSRPEGIMMLLMYVVYAIYIFMR